MDGELLTSMGRYTYCGFILTLAGCGPSFGSGENDISSDVSTSSMVTTGDMTVTSTSAPASSTTVTETSASSQGSTTAGSTGPIGEACPEPEPGGDGIGGIYSVEMETGVSHEVECEALEFGIRETIGATERVVDLACTLPGESELRALELVVTTDLVDAELQSLVGQTGLQLAYFQFAADFAGNPQRSPIFSLRNAEGTLLVLSNADAQTQPDDEPRTDMDVGSIWYLGDEPRKQAAWNDPFGVMFIRDVGCAQRPGTREHIVTEIPWALQFDSDDGPQSLYDQSMGSVSVEGQPFFVFVAAAFDGIRGEDSMNPGQRSLYADLLVVRALEP